MTMLRRRTVLAGLSGLPLTAARAQPVDFPDKPLRFVVGFPPGGPNDLLTRLIAPGIGERLGRAVVVDNRAGANGEIACASVAKAPPDGSVFMLASNGSTTVASALNPRLDRKSTRLNSSHLGISYAVFCLKKKKTNIQYHDIKTTHNSH